MKNIQSIIVFAAMLCTQTAKAQITNRDANGTFTAAGYEQNRQLGRSDSIQSKHQEIPRGLKVWTIDERFGDRTFTQPDTLSELYMNSIFNTGKYGEYNSLGNLGSPRQNRIFVDRKNSSEFLFTDPYDYFITEPGDFHFTQTLSPITVLDYNTAGNKTNGEDHFKAMFAVNIGKRWGLGFKFNYLYGRGYYSDQNTSHFNYSMWLSYLGERYQAHALFSTNHQKVSENGGIANDAYISHPEMFNQSYSEEEIPTILEKNWNRNDNQHIFFNHRYNVGFYRKVPMTPDEIEARKFAIRAQKEQEAQAAKDKARRQAKRNGEEFDEEEYDKEHASKGRPQGARIMGDAPKNMATSDTTRVKIDLQQNAAPSTELALDKTNDSTEWMKREYVPVTSFIHTLRFDNYRRIYMAYDTPSDYYANDYYTPTTFTGDSIYDQSKYWSLKNTFAIAMLEGFSKWTKAGVKAFVSSDMAHYQLPSITGEVGSESALFSGAMTSWNKHSLSVGGQILKTAGRTLHYNVSAETWLTGYKSGQLTVDGHADVNFPLLGDSVQVAATAFFHRLAPSFFMTTFHSRHFYWDDLNLDMPIHSRIMGQLSWAKTRTKLRVSYDMLKNYAYLGLSNTRTADGDNYVIKDLSVNVRQESSALSLFTAQLEQDFQWGILHWNNILTYQKSSNTDVLPLPDFNVYSNLFLHFKIAKVLDCDLGADVRYFTKYYAPEYIPGMGMFGIQENQESRTKIGNCPIINAYANFLLKHTRFFVMMSHINSGASEYFFTPHYPLNSRVFRFGVSWNFFN